MEEADIVWDRAGMASSLTSAAWSVGLLSGLSLSDQLPTNETWMTTLLLIVRKRIRVVSLQQVLPLLAGSPGKKVCNRFTTKNYMLKKTLFSKT